MLRLSTQYQVETHRQEAVKQLSRVAPAKIWDWCLLNDPLVDLDRAAVPDVQLAWPTDCIAVANLARELALPRVHATALYHCCQLPVRQLVEGIEHEDCSHDALSTEDIERCVQARHTLLKADHLVLHAAVARVATLGCTNPVLCGGIRRDYLASLSGPEAFNYISCGPLNTCVLLYVHGICKACEFTVRQDLGGACQKILDELETYFVL